MVRDSNPGMRLSSPEARSVVHPAPYLMVKVFFPRDKPFGVGN
jgi:hypothetical protein